MYTFCPRTINNVAKEEIQKKIKIQKNTSSDILSASHFSFTPRKPRAFKPARNPVRWGLSRDRNVTRILNYVSRTDGRTDGGGDDDVLIVETLQRPPPTVARTTDARVSRVTDVVA